MISCVLIFTEAVDKLRELREQANKQSTARKKLYNASSGTTSHESPTFAKRAVERRNATDKVNEEKGLTLIMTHSKLRELLESYRNHLDPSGIHRYNS